MKNKETRNKSGSGAVRTVGIMMGATVISKLLGMLRGVLQTRAWGTTPQAERLHGGVEAAARGIRYVPVGGGARVLHPGL